ncbi:hypothetical protein D3C80_1193140 [compost metagenome]
MAGDGDLQVFGSMSGFGPAAAVGRGKVLERLRAAAENGNGHANAQPSGLLGAFGRAADADPERKLRLQGTRGNLRILQR